MLISRLAHCPPTPELHADRVTGRHRDRSPAELNQTNGVIYSESTVRISARSPTAPVPTPFLFGEHARTNLMTYDPGFALSDSPWNSGRIYDTMFATWYPPNVGLSSGNDGTVNSIVSGSFYPETATSQHPAA